MYYLIVNPVSGRGRAAQHWQHIGALLQAAGVSYEHIFTEYAGHATALAKAAVEAGHRQLVAVGGDGTLNEVINGIFAQERTPPSSVKVGIIPIGTGNDWIRTHGIANDLAAAVQVLATGHSCHHDVGVAHFERQGQPHSRHFINVAGMAYDAHIGKLTHEKRGLVQNKFSYLWLILKELFSYRLAKMQLSLNDKIVEDYFYTIAVGVCRYNGGGMLFVPHALPDDGLLAVATAGNLPKWKVLLLTPRFYDGTLGSHRAVRHYQTATLSVVPSPQHPASWLELDGEFVGAAPVRFEVLPQAVQAIVPAKKVV